MSAHTLERRGTFMIKQRTEQLLSFHGDPAIKQKYVNRLKEHRRLEHLQQGTGWGAGKGCAVACTLEVYDHTLFPDQLGLPTWLAQLIDTVFENLPKGKAEQFARDVLDAIPIKVDVEPVKHTIAILQLTRLLDIMPSSEEPYYDKVITAIKQVIEYHKSPSDNANEAWDAAWDAACEARSAAEAVSIADSTAHCVACAAKSAARSAVMSMTSPAYSAFDAADAANAAYTADMNAACAPWSETWEKMATDLILELKKL